MKKKVIKILCVLLVLLIIGLSLIFIYKRYIINKIYNEMKENLDIVVNDYIKVSQPYCSVSSGDTIINERTLVNQAGMDKNIILDIDKESYCKVRVRISCIEENTYNWQIYLKCLNYEDKNYNNEL